MIQSKICDIHDTPKENIEEEYTNALGSLYLRLQAKHFLCDETLRSLIDGMRDLDDLNIRYFKSKNNLDTDDNITHFFRKPIISKLDY